MILDATALSDYRKLYGDLLCFSDGTLQNYKRLWVELEPKVESFKDLLDQKRRATASREHISKSDCLLLDDTEYSVNEQFRQNVIQIADELDLDELDSAKLFLQSLADGSSSDTDPLFECIVHYHEQRQLLLDCWRLILKLATDSDTRIEYSAILKDVVSHILGLGKDELSCKSVYWRKCVSSLRDIDTWLIRLSERIQSISIISPTSSSEVLQLLDYQRSNLLKQHESLTIIIHHLIQGGYITIDDFYWFLPIVRALDKHDINLVHYFLIISSLISCFGPADSRCSLHDANSMNDALIRSQETDSWTYRSFHSAVITLWVAEYSGRFTEELSERSADHDDHRKRSENCDQIIMESLGDGAFQFLLSTIQDIRHINWYDPIKEGLSSILLKDATRLAPDTLPSEEFFQLCFTEQIQYFVESLIANMPDVLRKLKLEEDDKRRLQHSGFQRGPKDLDLHLERFLLIISYAFDCAAEASQAFWTDIDGNLYGFLQWIARRQTTPRVAAFCEMFRSISQGEQCAEAAHRFLLDEKSTTSGKLKRSMTFNWSQIFAELKLFATNGREKLISLNTNIYQPNTATKDQVIEPESSIMLQSYLRLIAHLSSESRAVRSWVLTHSAPSLQEMLFHLASIGVESRLRANCFITIAALLKEKNKALCEETWNNLDNWLWNSHPSQINLPQSGVGTTSSIETKNPTLKLISADFEDSCAFIGLLQMLIVPSSDDSVVNDTTPFPENLGVTYRMPGIEDYVDFIVGDIFGTKVNILNDNLKKNILRWHCLQFIFTSLSTFNENLFLFANISQMHAGDTANSSTLLNYVCMHPFTRVMEWLYNDKVVEALFATAHCPVRDIKEAGPDSPVIAALVKSYEVIDLVLQYQSTYIDIVRPIIKEKYGNRRSVAANLASTCFEDAITSHLQIIVDLGLYCGSGHEDLTLISLRLLGKLASSRKLEVSGINGLGYRSNVNRIISIIQRDESAEFIAKSLVTKMNLNERDVEAGPQAPGVIIKFSILKLINNSLRISSHRPTLAHFFLGFSCDASTLRIDPESLFSRGQSMFHAIVRLLLDCHAQESCNFIPWISEMKLICMEILQNLWRSPLSLEIAISELRAIGFLSLLAQYQCSLDASLVLHEGALLRAEMLLTEASDGLRSFLQQRSAFLEYATYELRLAIKSGTPSLRYHLIFCLVGTVDHSNLLRIQNALILNLFEFAELDIPNSELEAPEMKYLGRLEELDFFKNKISGCKDLYKLDTLEEFLAVRLKEIKSYQSLKNITTEQELSDEASAILVHFLAHNKYILVIEAFKNTLKTWVQIMSIILDCFSTMSLNATTFILQAIQVILPKLDKANARNVFVALELADLMRYILQYLDQSKNQNGKLQDNNVLNERLSHLFRISLSGITSSIATNELREIYYQICYRYLRWLDSSTTEETSIRRQILRSIKNHGEHLIETLAEDVITGDNTCKTSSILMINAIITHEQREQISYTLSRLVHLNLIPVLLDDLRHMANELSGAKARDISPLLSYYNTVLSFLLRISQSRIGASHIFGSGLFEATNESQLFSTDPDIGFGVSLTSADIENSNALEKFFELMSSVLRLINSAVLSLGKQNSQIMKQALNFMHQNRASLTGVLKKKINDKFLNSNRISILDDVVDNITLLARISGFVKFDQGNNMNKSTTRPFS